MNVKDVLRSSFARSQMVTNMLLADLSDAEIMQRPAPGANHIAWQLGHLASSIQFFGETIRSDSMPPLPDGFADQHAKETAGSDDPAAFLSKDEYVKLLDEQRQVLLGLLDTLEDDDLLADTPEQMRDYAPKIIDMIGLTAEHEMMHSGQISVLRRIISQGPHAKQVRPSRSRSSSCRRASVTRPRLPSEPSSVTGRASRPMRSSSESWTASALRPP